MGAVTEAKLRAAVVPVMRSTRSIGPTHTFAVRTVTAVAGCPPPRVSAYAPPPAATIAASAIHHLPRDGGDGWTIPDIELPSRERKRAVNSVSVNLHFTSFTRFAAA